jgi:hypothetical protein
MGEADALGLLAREIALYLDERPDAVDTPDGILRWWLPRRRIDATPEMLQRALDVLVANGTIERRMLPDGRRAYGRVRVRGHDTDSRFTRE